jgi:hypothetical protein
VLKKNISLSTIAGYTVLMINDVEESCFSRGKLGYAKPFKSLQNPKYISIGYYKAALNKHC